MMHARKKALTVLLGLVLLSGCSATTSQKSSAKDTSVKTTYVSKRTKGNQKAWATAKAESQALAESAKKLSESESTLKKADEQASSQAASLSSSHAESVEAVKAASSSAAAVAAEQAEAASKSASKSAASAAEAQSKEATQSSSTKPSRANNFSGNTDTAQQGQIIGNSRSKIYHVETGHNYRMSGKNVVHFNTEAQAQAAGYRKSLR
ncbi:cell surface protein [Lactiplantibacillus paraxiangfangensis]|uniref:sunset domain-containing protein n=2 Tax=Lactiplantibacillus paraxiangfangensis TaxID=3076224 RepID=UPI0030C73508